MITITDIFQQGFMNKMFEFFFKGFHKGKTKEESRDAEQAAAISKRPVILKQTGPAHANTSETR
jgi:hypothetical protein